MCCFLCVKFAFGLFACCMVVEEIFILFISVCSAWYVCDIVVCVVCCFLLCLLVRFFLCVVIGYCVMDVASMLCFMMFSIPFRICLYALLSSALACCVLGMIFGVHFHFSFA